MASKKGNVLLPSTYHRSATVDNDVEEELKLQLIIIQRLLDSPSQISFEQAQAKSERLVITLFQQHCHICPAAPTVAFFVGNVLNGKLSLKALVQQIKQIGILFFLFFYIYCILFFLIFFFFFL